MSQTFAEYAEIAILLYIGVGLILCVPLALWGTRRIDPSAGNASLGFHVIIVPSCVVLWPWFLTRVASGKTAPPTEVNNHRVQAR